MSYDPIVRRYYADSAVRHDIALLEAQLERAATPPQRQALQAMIDEKKRRLEAAPSCRPSPGPWRGPSSGSGRI
jgi:hypothetical protein